MEEETKTRELSPKQEEFCRLFTTDTEFFGNGVQSYIEVYDIDLTKPGAYAGARASASRLLSNANILAHIDKLLDLYLTDQHVDKQLALVITQNADFNAKVAAIREYNKLKSRITEKIEHSGKIENTLSIEQINELLTRRNKTDIPGGEV